MPINNNSYFDATAFKQAYEASATKGKLDPNNFQTASKCGAEEALTTIGTIIKDIGEQLGNVKDDAKSLELSKLRDSLSDTAKGIKKRYEQKAKGYCSIIRWLFGTSAKVARITDLYRKAVGFHAGKGRIPIMRQVGDLNTKYGVEKFFAKQLKDGTWELFFDPRVKKLI